jgi:tetratricopeptide (TPR) repeat protein
MAKVSLRIYDREIESLIDQGGTDEAIAHCRHILGTYPKHLETYRLLGKSYLESHRYTEAVDVFSRVLMSVPDDFVSHVGMSIIRDEENKLDDSIWHMERAFESQPSNPAIQGELQRLYGRRDGMEPPKVRMTRGALAQMYMQGELYPQAIAEIRAVLGQDANRADMQVLLARAYFKSGQKADSSDICNQLLRTYPYCFEANRIMTELSPSTAAATDGTEIYRARVGELDPYAGFTKGSVFQSNEVADTTINLERLEYTGEEVKLGREWGSSLGIGLSASTAPALTATVPASQPDWLSGFSSTEPDALASNVFDSTEEAPKADSQSPVEIPDFLRSAGWGESTGAVDESVPAFEDSGASVGETLAPASMPDWLKGQVPTEAVSPFGSMQGDPTSAPSTDTPDWLGGLGGATTAEPVPPQASETPDWLGGLAGAQSPASSPPAADETPDWLSGLGGGQFSEQPSPAKPAESPDWLSGLGGGQFSEQPGTAPTNDAPDWLSGLGRDQQSASPDPTQNTGPAQPANIPDWINQPAGQPAQSSAASTGSLGTSAQEQDDAVAWLESLAAKHGAKPEELVTDPNKRSDTPPQWVEQSRQALQSPAPPAATINNLGASAQEQDDAVAWLESLAAKHGAKPEELVTDPNKRSDTPPDWVEQSRMASQTPIQPPATVKNLGASAQEQDDAVAWLESLAAKHGAKPEELVTDPKKRSETPPDWVQQARSAAESQPDIFTESTDSSMAWSENAQNIGEQYFAEFETPATSANDETGMWLRNKEEKEKQDQVKPVDATPATEIPDWITAPENQQNKMSPTMNPTADPSLQKTGLPDWLGGNRDLPGAQEYTAQNLSEGDLSDWLSGLDEGPAAIPVPTESVHGDLPDWLSGIDANEEKQQSDWKKPADTSAVTGSSATKPPEEPASVSNAEDLPDWLQGVDGGFGEPEKEQEDISKSGAEAQLKPTSPTDWHPVEPKVEPPTIRRTDLSARPPMPKPKPSAAQSMEPVYEPLEGEEPYEPAEVFSKSFMSPPPSMPQKPVQPAVPVQKPMQEQPAELAQPVAQKPLAAKKGGRPVETQPTSSALTQAKGELDRGDIPTALEHYGKLIKKGKHLEETIRDLSDSIYRYPVEVGIWQTLGDAYMRANRLKEALEAYNKAEELIR